MLYATFPAQDLFDIRSITTMENSCQSFSELKKTLVDIRRMEWYQLLKNVVTEGWYDH
jgi:hypothetical protein